MARRHLIWIAAVLLTACGLCHTTLGEESAARQAPLMRDFMGINAHTVQFKADLFSQVCRLVRDYHPLGWDFGGDTSADTAFPFTRSEVTWKDESGLVGDFAGRPNWKEIYSRWQADGFEIDVSIMFGGIPPEDWKDIPADAYKYGKAFAEYFGPSGENKLAAAAEIGNEPSAYDDATYRTLFEAMARGLREGDPKLTIVTSAAWDDESHGTRKSLACVKGLEDLYDVINIHTYAHKHQHPDRWPLYIRSYPEDPDPGMRYLSDVRDVIAWRDTNAPGKEIWITEFGWDAAARQAAETGPHTKWTDVTDDHQAQYIVRAFLDFSSMGVDRAYLYWFNDSDQPSVHAASGITRFNRPKPSFYAMRHLYRSLGDYRFHRIIRQDVGKLYVYEFVRGDDPAEIVWVAWEPTDTLIKKELTLPLPAQPYKAERMPLTAEGPGDPEIKRDEDGNAMIEVNGSPLYLWMRLEEPAAE